MRNILKAVGAAALLVAVPALADEWDFVLTNSTGKEIKTVELAPNGTTTWQANKVDPDVAKSAFKNGSRSTIHFDKDGKQCNYDLKITFTDGASAVWSKVNVCDNSFVTVKYANDTPTFSTN